MLPPPLPRSYFSICDSHIKCFPLHGCCPWISMDSKSEHVALKLYLPTIAVHVKNRKKSTLNVWIFVTSKPIDFYNVTSKTCYQLLQLHFLRWNIVFFSSLIIAIIVLSLVVGSSVWDVQEKRLWCSCSSTRRNLICGSWISWSFLLILSSEIMWYTRVYQHVNLLWKQYASDFVLTHYLPASTHHQSDQSLRLWVISIRKMYPSDSFL